MIVHPDYLSTCMYIYYMILVPGHILLCCCLRVQTLSSIHCHLLQIRPWIGFWKLSHRWRGVVMMYVVMLILVQFINCGCILIVKRLTTTNFVTEMNMLSEYTNSYLPVCRLCPWMQIFPWLRYFRWPVTWSTGKRQ